MEILELVQYGRGCRFACDFCSIRTFYQDNSRQRDPESVAEELSAISRILLIFCVDDNLSNSVKALNALLEAITPLRLRWSCQISIDVAKDEKLLDRKAEAGCVFALVGFESLSELNLRQMGKRWNKVSGDYHSVVEKFHKRGIAIYGTFVFGYDADTAETIQQTLDFAMEAKLEIANFNPLTPTPATRLYQRLQQEQRLVHPHWWLEPAYRYGQACFIPRGMTADELTEGCFQARRQFYSHSSILRRCWSAFRTANRQRSTGIFLLANYISRREILRKQSTPLGSGPTMPPMPKVVTR